MRYGLTLLAGLIGGFLLAELRKQPEATPENTIATPIEQKKSNATQAPSPFAPVASTKKAFEKKTSTAGIPTLTTSSPIDPTYLPVEATDVGELQHYSQLARFFVQLETANADQLQQLAQEVRSRFRFNYDNQYFNTISAAVYQRWADVDFDAALNSLADLQDRMNGPDMGIHMNMLQVLAREQPQRIQAWVQTQNGVVKDMVQHTIYASMAQNDPQAMVREALQMNSPDSESMLHMALSQWAMEDPSAAWVFMQGTTNPESHRGALETILRTWVDTDATGALPMLEQLVSDSSVHSDSNDNYTEIYLMALARTDPQSALDYLTNQNNHDQLYSNSHGVFYELASQHPALLETWLQQMPVEQMEQLGPMAVMPLIEMQAMNDPQAAMAMIEKFPQAHAADMQSMILDQWLMTDSSSAIEWLKTQAPTEENQTMLQQAALMLIHSSPDPITGLSLIEQLNFAVDEQIAVQIAFTVGNRDPQVARDWLGQNTDAETYAIASAAIDVADNSIPTEQILQQLESTGVTLQPHIIMEILHTRIRDRDVIIQWLETTSTMPEAERSQIKMMLGIGDDDGAAVYFRSEAGVVALPYDQ